MSRVTNGATPRKNAESKTKVYQKVHGGRSVVSIRCRPEIIERLKEFCEANDVSICHIFEAMATGYLEGMKQKINWVNQSPTIELSVVREVKRIRRYAREYGPSGVQIETSGSFEKCAFGCSGPVVARHFVYSDGQHCLESYVCAKHHEELKRQRASWTMV